MPVTQDQKLATAAIGGVGGGAAIAIAIAIAASNGSPDATVPTQADNVAIADQLAEMAIAQAGSGSGPVTRTTPIDPAYFEVDSPPIAGGSASFSIANMPTGWTLTNKIVLPDDLSAWFVVDGVTATTNDDGTTQVVVSFHNVDTQAHRFFARIGYASP